MTWLGRLVVGFVAFIILYIGYTAQYVMFIYFEGWTHTSKMVLGLYNFLVIGVLWNYYLACTSDPGAVPKDWRPQLDGPVLEVKKSNLKPRYCKTCKCYKPPRSHHCSTCERCVLKMDHHCPWLNNCVGFRNYGHFIRFIFFVDVACSLCLYILVMRTLQLFDDSYVYQNREFITTLELGLLITNIVGVVPVLFCVSMLSLFQFYGMGENTTTIEGWEKDKVSALVRRGKVKEVRFPYDIGVYRNITSVLGPNPLLWCVPQDMLGDGLSFPVTQYADGGGDGYSNINIEEGTLIWPPPEYSRDERGDGTKYEDLELGSNPSGGERTFRGRVDSEGELVVPTYHNRPVPNRTQQVNKAPYTTYLDSDDDSEFDETQFPSLESSDDDEDDRRFGEKDMVFMKPIRARSNSTVPSLGPNNGRSGTTNDKADEEDDDDSPLANLIGGTNITRSTPRYKQL